MEAGQKIGMATGKTSHSPSPGSASRWDGLLDGHSLTEMPVDVAGVLQHLVKLVQNVAPDHAVGIFLIEEDTRTIQGQVTDLFDHDLNVGEGALQAALRNPASYVITSLPAGRPLQNALRGVRTQIVIPFRASPRVRGALVLRSKKSRAYTPNDGEALSAFTIQASAMIESALIHQKVLQKGDGDVERDLVTAQEILARLIPQKPPQIPGFEIASIYMPAKIVGGDLLDYIVLPDDHYGFLVADAAGHGIPSALMMTGFRALFRGLIQNDFNIRSVFRKANQQLVESTAAYQFVSAFYAAVDATTGRLIYVNGGHVPPWLYRPAWPPRKLDVGGPVLGVLPAASYHEDSVVLRPKDIMVCYSDGLSEAESAEGTAFGYERILQVIEHNQHNSAQVICDTLRDQATKLAGPNLRDDMTICVLKFL